MSSALLKERPRATVAFAIARPRYKPVMKRCLYCKVAWKYGPTVRRCGSCGGTLETINVR